MRKRRHKAAQTMTTPSAGSDNPAPQPCRSIVSILGTALLGAVLGGIALPFVTFFAALILAGLTSGCANDSGGCAMWAGSVAIASVPVWAVIMFGLGLYSGLKSR
jgi:predicted lipid-binding transport protein (Tim44 family)